MRQKTAQLMKKKLIALTAPLVRRRPLVPTQLLELRPARILVVRQQNQMGDMVCATPVFRALRENFPEAEIGLVTAPVNVEVVRHNPHLDRIFTFDQRMWRNPGRLLAFLREVRGFQAELVFVLASVSFSVTSAGIGLASGAKWVVGADSLPFGLDLSRHIFSLEMPSRKEVTGHAIEHSLAPMRAIGINTADLSTVVVPAPGELAKAEEIRLELGLEQGFWAIHPGAGKKQNIWPAAGFAQVMRRALEMGARILLLHGPADREVLAELEELLADEMGRGVLAAPPCPVGVGAALLDGADRFLCNDTGIMHIAGALGVPTLALFGPTDPDLWKPPVDSVKALRRPADATNDRAYEFGGMENIDPERVWMAWSTLPSRAGS
ncbi:MAG: glycosyltransferase family 9 protein [Gemmatimonadales bacterium]|nr:glycosyltransferase family 9 protein [Gemmatimonadales bacterium]